MKKMRKKNGETLVESLMAILLLVLAVSIFGGYILVSERLVDRSKEQKKRFYREVSYLESLKEQEVSEELLQETGEAVVTISVKKQGAGARTLERIPVILYYGEHMAVYEVQDE